MERSGIIGHRVSSSSEWVFCCRGVLPGCGPSHQGHRAGRGWTDKRGSPPAIRQQSRRQSRRLPARHHHVALGWIGEPALAHLIEPLLSPVLGAFAVAGSHVAAVVIAFIIITTLHIVLGELAPKSLALQRSEGTALWVAQPLALFLFLFRPAIGALNGLGNLVLRLCGLRPGTGEESLHSPEELKLLVSASQEGGLLQKSQQEVVERVFNIGDRRISSIMTPRPEVDWIDLEDDRDEILRAIRASSHDQLLVGKGRRAE